MTDRIDMCLDDELSAEELTAGERAQVERVRAAVRTYRASLPATPMGIEAAVMQRIGALQPLRAQAPARPVSWLRSAGRALWQPRTLTIRPALAAAALVLIAIATVFEVRGGMNATAAAEAPLVYVQFRLEADGASSVSLAGSFTAWQPEHQLVEAAPGIWTIVVGLPPGVHDYAFVVDREHWVVDPAAATIDDGFGGQNSRIALLPS